MNSKYPSCFPAFLIDSISCNIRVIRGYVCGSTVTSVLTELAMKHCS
jgi:hypothetical protein